MVVDYPAGITVLIFLTHNSVSDSTFNKTSVIAVDFDISASNKFYNNLTTSLRSFGSSSIFLIVLKPSIRKSNVSLAF